jgi:hypothetical protein
VRATKLKPAQDTRKLQHHRHRRRTTFLAMTSRRSAGQMSADEVAGSSRYLPAQCIVGMHAVVESIRTEIMHQQQSREPWQRKIQHIYAILSKICSALSHSGAHAPAVPNQNELSRCGQWRTGKFWSRRRCVISETIMLPSMTPMRVWWSSSAGGGRSSTSAPVWRSLSLAMLSSQPRRYTSLTVCSTAVLFLRRRLSFVYKAEEQRKGKSPNSKAAKTMSNQNDVVCGISHCKN